MEERNSRFVLWQGKVRDYECDSTGVVYHPVYSQYMDEARKEFLAALKIDLISLAKANLIFSVIRSAVNYRGSLKKNDQFFITTEMKRTSKIQFHFTQRIYRLPERTLITKSTNVIQFINARNNCPELPHELETLLTDYPSPD